MSRERVLDFIKLQGRIAFALLALLGASIASAHTFTTNRAPAAARVPQDVQRVVQPGVPWVMTPTFRLPEVSVQVSHNALKPTYRMKLPNGEVLDLPQSTPVVTRGLSPQDLSMAAEDTRVVLKAVAQVIEGCANCASGTVDEDGFARAMEVEKMWAAMQKLRGFDPIHDAINGEVSGRETSAAIIASRDKAVAVQTYRQRLQNFWQFVRDAVYTSTIEAYRVHRAHHAQMKGHIQEWGIQFALRAEIQVGIGKFSITKNYPMLFNFGYNRVKKSLVFRRSIRSEKMAGGTAFSVGGKVEIKFYRASADQLDAADERAGYAAAHGQSWYPPSLPMISLVFDSAPGYQGEGLAFGFNLADLIPGAYLMNTVTSYKEEQRVYSTPLPEPQVWMKRMQAQLNDSSNMFAGASRGARCEALFGIATAH